MSEVLSGIWPSVVRAVRDSRRLVNDFFDGAD